MCWLFIVMHSAHARYDWQLLAREEKCQSYVKVIIYWTNSLFLIPVTQLFVQLTSLLSCSLIIKEAKNAQYKKPLEPLPHVCQLNQHRFFLYSFCYHYYFIVIYIFSFFLLFLQIVVATPPLAAAHPALFFKRFLLFALEISKVWLLLPSCRHQFEPNLWADRRRRIGHYSSNSRHRPCETTRWLSPLLLLYFFRSESFCSMDENWRDY